MILTLTRSQGYRSSMNIKKWFKTTGHILDAISRTDFILGTKVQPKMAHSITKGQYQISPKCKNNLNKRATPKWVTKSCDNRYDVVCGWNSLRDMNSSLVFYPFLRKFNLTFDLHPRSMSSSLGSLNAPYRAVTWVLPIFFGKIWLWPWPWSSAFGSLMRLIGLYHGAKYEVCRWNSLQDMTSSLVFYTII